MPPLSISLVLLVILYRITRAYIFIQWGKKTDPVISNLLEGSGDGFTGSIITRYTERGIVEYE